MKISLLIFVAGLFASTSLADTYGIFKTTRYYSAQQKYFVEIKEDKTIRLFLAKSPKRPIWGKVINEFPAKVFVRDTGDRVILFERYYGNNHKLDCEAVIIFDEKGEQLKHYPISKFSDLRHSAGTTSQSAWYDFVCFSPGERSFVLQTIRLKTDNIQTCENNLPQTERTKCWEFIPEQQFHIDLTTGEIINTYRLLAD